MIDLVSLANKEQFPRLAEMITHPKKCEDIMFMLSERKAVHINYTVSACEFAIISRWEPDAVVMTIRIYWQLCFAYRLDSSKPLLVKLLERTAWMRMVLMEDY